MYVNPNFLYTTYIIIIYFSDRTGRLNRQFCNNDRPRIVRKQSMFSTTDGEVRVNCIIRTRLQRNNQVLFENKCQFEN